MMAIKSLLSRYGWGLWRQRWYGVGTAWAICVVGWIVVSQIPNQYESLARIYMNADQTLSSLLHGISVDDDVNSRLDRMQRTLLSATNMKRLIQTTDLESEIKDPSDTERMVTHLQQNISIKLQTRNLFTVSYRDPDPVLAQNVVSNLLAIFMESSAGESRGDIGSAQRFVQSQLDRLEASLRAAEKKKSDFQTQYYDLLPIAGSSSLLEQSRANVQQLGDDLADAVAQSASIQKQVALVPAYDAAPTTSSLPGRDEGLSLSPKTRLAQLTTQLEAARATMKPEHPVVLALQHQIDAITAEIAANRGSGKEAAHAQTANLLYRDMKMKLVDQEAKVASLQRRLESAQESRDKIEAEARAAPGVVAQFTNLDRDYEVIKKSYDDLLARRESAQIAEEADKKGDKMDVRTIDPPEVPSVPAAPNRMLFLSIVLAAGIVGGIGVAFFLVEIDRSLGDAKALEAFGFPVLGSISLDPAFTRREAPWFSGIPMFSALCLALLLTYGGLLLTIVTFQEKGI
jgi:polysaccharide chain length determinant protein (PEP-CTERM system associated)